jgi:hypothetical protein
MFDRPPPLVSRTRGGLGSGQWVARPVPLALALFVVLCLAVTPARDFQPFLVS